MGKGRVYSLSEQRLSLAWELRPVHLDWEFSYGAGGGTRTHRRRFTNSGGTASVFACTLGSAGQPCSRAFAWPWLLAPIPSPHRHECPSSHRYAGLFFDVGERPNAGGHEAPGSVLIVETRLL